MSLASQTADALRELLASDFVNGRQMRPSHKPRMRVELKCVLKDALAIVETAIEKERLNDN